MALNKILLFSFLILRLIGISQIEERYNNKNVQNDYVNLNGSIYISKTELSTGEYAKFLASVKSDSSEKFYENQLPDSASLDYIEFASTYSCGCGPMYISRYEHPAYFDYPAFGLSYEQVNNYCRWLTKSSDTIKINGEYYALNFRLPTESEWNLANESSMMVIAEKKEWGYVEEEYCDRNWRIFDSLNIEKRDRSKIICSNYNVGDIGIFVLKDSIYQYYKSQPNCYSTKQQPNYVNDLISNQIGLFHLNDNLSEMLSTKGIAKGFNYLTASMESQNGEVVNYTKPEPWLGARLVCELIKINK